MCGMRILGRRSLITMAETLKFLLPVYLFLYLFFALIWRVYILWKKTGKITYTLHRARGPQAIMGKMVPFLGGLAVVDVMVFSFGDNNYEYLSPFFWLNIPLLKIIGLILMTIALVWMVIAQSQMGLSWRLGLDEQKTELVVARLYRFSRNPIYVGMRTALVGFFLTLPNAISLLIWIMTDFLIQMQVRFEEDHMLAMHGEKFVNYRKQVNRWWGRK